MLSAFTLLSSIFLFWGKFANIGAKYVTIVSRIRMISVVKISRDASDR